MNPFQQIFDAQKAYFATNVTRSYDWRIAQLNSLERMIAENTPQLRIAIAADFKTSRQEFEFETDTAIAEIEFQKSQLKGWMEPVEEPIPRFLVESGHKGYVYREPRGVTLVIGPFNGPLSLLIRPVAGVLAAGNTVIMKPSEALAHTTAVLKERVPEYFDPRAVVVASSDRAHASALTELPLDFIFFTGSSRTGKIVARAAAENLVPMLLELGGQNPAIVDETANLADAAKKIVWGAMAWGGQWCTSPGYAYVHESVADDFADHAKRALVELYGDDPKSNSDFSRIISEHDVTRLAGLIDPAKVIAGGGSDPAARYLDPTIIYPVTWDDAAMADEIFGPILPILKYQTLDEAFARIAATPRPLAAYVFTQDQRTIDRYVNELSFGCGCVNQANINVLFATMPFGGTGYSGLGHYYGRYGFDQLTHAKSVVVAPADVAIDHLYPPATDEKIAEFNSKWMEYSRVGS
jgi:aldehyde dehydrogenase (NAD+)